MRFSQMIGRGLAAPKKRFCRAVKPLVHDPNAFDMHVLLSQMLAGKGQHENAALHARKGLESYPEPLKIQVFSSQFIRPCAA